MALYSVGILGYCSPKAHYTHHWVSPSVYQQFYRCSQFLISKQFFQDWNLRYCLKLGKPAGISGEFPRAPAVEAALGQGACRGGRWPEV